MRAVVVDTSVVVKWFSREKDDEAARRLRGDLIGERVLVMAPDLLLYELANALRFHPRFSAEDVAAAVDSVIDLGIRLIPAPACPMREAAETAFKTKITAYDAVFASLAAAESIPLITADEKLAGKVGSACRVIPLGRYDGISSIEL